jgi:antitoxin VapB
MSLNIKNERVHDLAREAAKLTGKSQTAVIQEALERYLDGLAEVDEHELRRRRLDIVYAQLDRDVITDEDRVATKKFMDELYDENGLPV